MSSLADPTELVGFFSYSREDDDDANGALSVLRDRIQRELRGQLGRTRAEFRVWQDTVAIAHGTLWEEQIKAAIGQSVFFLPIITPTAVNSRHCKTEFELFLKREAELDRNDLIFPILYIKVPALQSEDQRRQNDVLKIIHARQYADWTEIRYDLAAPDVGKQIARFCESIARALQQPWVSPEKRRRIEEAEAEQPKADDAARPARQEADAARPTKSERRTTDTPTWWGWLIAAAIAVFAAAGVFAPRENGPPAAPRVPPPPPLDVQPLLPNRERALKPKDTFSECSQCPEMLVVPAGSFTMGSNVSENEKPPHRVTLRQPFAVGKFEVTFDEWDACVAHRGCTEMPSDNSWGRSKRPVINVSWNDAEQYVAWIAKLTGKPYRLLTEAEWEYAARAGTTTTYSWGNDIGEGNANCDGCGSQWHNETAPVGSFKPNGFGLYDMHGNVREWCEDAWHDNYKGAPTDGSAWLQGGNGFFFRRRVVRGGSWVYGPQELRSANRSGFPVYQLYPGLGFRLARTLNP
jgi:formylglycine-generating enzyme required for sulfatase activity